MGALGAELALRTVYKEFDRAVGAAATAAGDTVVQWRRSTP
jgi:hypothetical protein